MNTSIILDTWEIWNIASLHLELSVSYCKTSCEGCRGETSGKTQQCGVLLVHLFEQVLTFLYSFCGVFSRLGVGLWSFVSLAR